MQFFVFFDAINQSLYALKIHCVIAARTEAAYQTVTLDTYHTFGGSELEEIVLQFLISRLENETDIHAAAVLFLADRRHKQLAFVQTFVQQLCFRFVTCFNPFNAAVCFEPAKGQQSRINRQDRRSVEHRTAVDMRLIIQHRRDITAHFAQTTLFDDHECYSGRS